MHALQASDPGRPARSIGAAPVWSRLIVVVGPSGAGKDTMLRLWRERLGADPRVHFVRRLITRPADPAGEDHRPVWRETFHALQAEGRLAFDWQAHGLLYGVAWESLAPLDDGAWVVLSGCRQHLPELRQKAPGCRVVEIAADVRRLRLDARDGSAARDRPMRPPAPAPADLSLVDQATPEECVARLDRWWRALAAGREAPPG